MTPKTLIVFSSYPWNSALAYLRFRAPAEGAGWRVLPGYSGDEVFAERIASADLVLFQRDIPRLNQVYAQGLAFAREYHKPIVYEMDDWLFAVPDDHPFQGEYVAVLNWMLAAVVDADLVIASTENMRENLQAFRADVAVWPNYLPDDIWTLKPAQPDADHETVTIGYMGTLTHGQDLALIAPVLSDLLDQYGVRLRLRILGLDPPVGLADHPQISAEKIDIQDYAEFAAYFFRQQVDIWIAPLRDTPFNRSKSAIKFLEYSALGAPGVYSRIQPYQEVIKDGQDGFLAGSLTEWKQALQTLIDDPDLRYRIGATAQQTVKTNWMLSAHLSEWDDMLGAVLDQGEARPPTRHGTILSEISRQVDRHLQMQKSEIERLTRENHELRVQIQAQAEEIVAQAEEIVALQLRSIQLDEILASRSWRLMQKVQGLRLTLIPQGSQGEKVITRAANTLRGGCRDSLRSAASPTISPEAYRRWLTINEPDSAGLESQRQQVTEFTYQPLLSIITPLYNTPDVVLQEMIQSVLAQTYPHWQLCLVDGASDDPQVRQIAQSASDQEPRIRFQSLERNQGISGNSNTAIALAQGEFLVFLDHDDLLAPNALFEIAAALNQNRDWDFLYSDYDLLTPDGSQRFAPLFKPGWSPEIMLSGNYLTHLTVIRKSLVDAVGGFHAEFDGAQDWDLFLRVLESSDRVRHIPKVLYHWRDSAQSTAKNIWQKDYAPQAQLRAITEHLQRKGFDAPEAFFDSSGFIRVRWAFDRATKISVIIPSNGANRLLEKCVDSIRQKTLYSNFEVIIVNNGPASPEEFPFYAQLTEDPRFKVVHDGRPFNYSAVNNFGVTHATGDLLVFLNNDTVIRSPDWLDEFVMWSFHPEVGAVGPKLLMPDGTIQHAGVILGLTGFAGHVFAGLREGQSTIFGLTEWYRDYLALTAACVAIRRSLFEEIGGFDESLVLCGNDVELCFRVRKAGLRVVYNPFIRISHEESATRQGPIPPQDFRESYTHYQPYLQGGDPYFNPNLSMWSLIPALREADEQHPDQFAIKFLCDLNI
jgi:GT2 family glycosyltransferase/glycosyltransferase involved in cell wall biosynthesis